MKSSNIIKGNLVGITISDGFEVLDKSVDPSGEGVVCNSAGWHPIIRLNVRSSLKHSAVHSLAYDVDKAVIFLTVVQ